MHARNLSRARAQLAIKTKRKRKRKRRSERFKSHAGRAANEASRARPLAGLFSRCGEPRSAGVAGRRRHGNPRKVQGGPGYQRNQGIRAASESSCMRPVAKVAVSTSVKH